MFSKTNFFWRNVYGHSHDYEIQAIDTLDLKEAAYLAVNSESVDYSFRRNRELIDLKSKFRHFIFRERAYILKIASKTKGVREIQNAKEARDRLAHKRLTSGIELDVLVPLLVDIRDGRCALVTPDHGHTLHEDIDSVDCILPVALLQELIGMLLDEGIHFSGLVPRNIIFQSHPQKIILIDWEDARFTSSNEEKKLISSLTIFKWVLNWSQFYRNSSSQENRSYILSVPQVAQSVIYDGNLDEFEETYQSIIEINTEEREIRSRCSEATLMSELPLPALSNSALMTPMELGHLIDDLLPVHLSVFYTFSIARIRSSNDSELYVYFARAMSESLCKGLIHLGAVSHNQLELTSLQQLILLVTISFVRNPCSEICELICRTASYSELISLLKASDTLCAALIDWKEFSGKTGMNVAVSRADSLDVALEGLFQLGLSAFDIKDPLNLLLRGSLGQKIVSRVSDVDFEISGESYPEGRIGLESYIGSALDIFGIQWEGSQSRPVEIDLVGQKGLTRDLHEWMELRQAGSYCHSPGWLELHFNIEPDTLWSIPSQYEQQGGKLSEKYLFFEARALIARLSFKHGLSIASTSEQLSALAEFLTTKEINELIMLLTNSLSYYEKNEPIPLDALTELQMGLRNARANHEIAGPC